MKITIVIPDDCYGDCLDEDDNLIIIFHQGLTGQKVRSYWTGHLMNGNVSDLRWLV